MYTNTSLKQHRLMLASSFRLFMVCSVCSLKNAHQSIYRRINCESFLCEWIDE